MAASIYRLRVIGVDSAGNQWNNVLHFVAVTTTGSEDSYAVAGDLITTWWSMNQTAMLACLPTDTTVSYIQCRRINNGGGNAFTLALFTLGAGGGTGSTIAVGACLKFLTSSAKQFGRFFLAGVWDGAVEGDNLQVAYLTACTTLNTSLQNPIVGTLFTYNLVVYSRKTLTALTIIDRGVATVIGIQRKRRVPIM